MPRAHAPGIAVVRQGMELPARRASEHRDERRLAELGDLANGLDASEMELLGGDPADAPEALDGKRMEERQLVGGRNDEEAVGLGDAARDLREELRPRHADRDTQADLLEHSLPQPRRDLGGCSGEALEAADVEERLVDRHSLDERRRVLEQREHRLARFRVRRHAGLDPHRVRAQPARLEAAHRRADPVRLRLVARGEHDPEADDNGSPA